MEIKYTYRNYRRRWLGAVCRKMKPTRRHRPAVWECILGTVYAMNEAGECRYFDYNYEDAFAFAGVDMGNATGDNRINRVPKDRRCGWVRSGCSEANPRPGKFVFWVLKQEKK